MLILKMEISDQRFLQIKKIYEEFSLLRKEVEEEKKGNYELYDVIFNIKKSYYKIAEILFKENMQEKYSVIFNAYGSFINDINKFWKLVNSTDS